MNKEYSINYRRLLEAATESILVTTTDLDQPGPTIIYVNPAFEKMTGWSKNEILGKSPRILQGPKTDTTIFTGFRESIRDRSLWKGQTTNYRKNGEEFVMEWSVTPVLDENGSIIQYLAVQRDITQRVENERLLEDSRVALIASLKKREQMRDIFGKFVPETVADRILSDSGQLTPDIREATIFYSDIKGFSKLTELMNPTTILDLLNEYFSIITEEIERKGGVVHQFQGDAILASFNLPLNRSSHPSDAVDAALEILRKLDTHQFINSISLFTRIGINTGQVVAGTVGNSGRLGYTVHGDAVNLAAHIEQENKRFGTDILISESTVRQLVEHYPLCVVDTLSIKNRAQPVTLYTIEGAF